MVKDFIKHFTDKDIGNIIKIHKKYYLVSEELMNVNEKVDLSPEYIGVYLGDDTAPSVALIDIISKISDKKVFINDKAEYLFLCGRDIFGESITKANIDKKGELVLVQNKHDENLGYGEIVLDLRKKDQSVILNKLDRGDFLRREM